MGGREEPFASFDFGDKGLGFDELVRQLLLRQTSIKPHRPQHRLKGLLGR